MAAAQLVPASPTLPGAGPSAPAVGVAAPTRPGPVRSSWRARTRRRPVVGPLWRSAVFLTGLLCVVAGVGLAVLPGPLTIPPVLLGLYVWSTEFTWARRLFGVVRTKARQAWTHARRHPIGDGAITVGGLVLAAGAVWSAAHFHLLARVGALFGS